METLEGCVGAVHEAWAGALPPMPPCAARDGADVHGSDAAGLGAQLESMSDAGLLRVTEAVGRLGRSTDALMTRLAGEVARRSSREAGANGLAKRQGYRNPAQLVADATGGAFAEAVKLVGVGVSTAGQRALTGEALPPKHPHVADALHTGSISVDAAAAIARMLDRVQPRVAPSDSDRFERLLAQRAAGLPLDLLNRAVADVEARLDPDGVEPREEELRAARSLTLRQDGRGMVRISGALDPETGAPVMAAIQGIVSHAVRAARDSSAESRGRGGRADGDAPPTAVVPDGRSIPQLQADALAMIARHVIGCDLLPAAPAASVIVRMDLDALGGGRGHAEIDGLTQPVSAGAARRMAAAAGLIPMVFGTDSLPLDVGRAARGFTPAQRAALRERDGGCACCGLDVPYTEAHHIKWWVRERGRTDLSNGVLLCQACHARVHADGWGITADRNQVWFTPPAHVDPDRVPRLGGRARFRMEIDRRALARAPADRTVADRTVADRTVADRTVTDGIAAGGGIGGVRYRPRPTESVRPPGRDRDAEHTARASAEAACPPRRSRVEFRPT